MDEDTSQKDPQDTDQTGGTTPPAQDQPEEQKPAETAPAEEVAEAPAEPAAEEPKPEEPAEAPAEPAAEEPKPEEPAEAPVTPPEPVAEETPVEEKPEEPAETPAEEPTEVPAITPEPTAETPAEESKPAEPAETPTEEPKPATPTETPASQPTEKPEDCGCPTINEAEWHKQKKTIDKTFYKTWSPRLFYYPFSFSIDVSRAKQGALNAKYTIPENPMVLDTGGMFWSTVMIEVQGANPEDKNVVSLKGKEFYTKVSKRPWKEMKTDMEELKQELGKEPTELYIWYGACPKCMDKKDVKTVFIAA